ncbi:MAG: polysaccharide biosynthesis C-terminal domain-containing protein [Cytophagales bacterium]|nr:polysaccharide biosynthesis C-terminal domain-containing protein [Cytophagales bacterium]
MTASNGLGEAPVSTLFFKYYVPALTSIFSVAFHQVINGVILGQEVGREGVAVVGLYNPVLVMLVALALPVMIGSSILLGKSIGAADYGHAQRIFAFATTVALLLGGAVALCSPLLVTPLSNFLAGAGNASLAGNVAGYLRWQLVGLPLFFLNMFWGSLLRNDGNPDVSRNASLVAVGVNVGLDLLLVVGLHLGVEGASLATVFSSAAAAGYLAFYVQRGKNHFGFRGFRFTLRLAGWRELLRTGLPTFASEVSFSTGLLLIGRAAVPYGPGAVAAFGLVNNLSFIFIRLFTSAMIAALPIMSFNLGARLPGRVVETARFAAGFTLLLGLVVAVLGLAAPGWLIALFAGDATAAFRQVAGGALAWYFLLFLAAGPNYILGAYLQSTGKPGVATAIHVLKGLVLVAGSLAVLPGVFGLGLRGVWLSRSGAEILTLVLVGGYTWAYREKYYGEKGILGGK